MGLHITQTAYRLIALPFFVLLIAFVSLWHSKTRRSLVGHQGLYNRLKTRLQLRDPNKNLVWFHVASAGEYLKVRPVIDELDKGGVQAIVTYSSISAREWLEKDFQQLPALLAADFLPLDSRRNMRKMIRLIRPDSLVYLRYDLWPNLVWLAQKEKIPQLLFAAALPSNATRHKNKLARYFYLSLYQAFSGIYTVTESDAEIYRQYSLPDTEVKTLGDTGFDTVWQRAQSEKVKMPDAWAGKLITLVGSHWPEDEREILPALKTYFENNPDSILIFAPHEVNENSVNRIRHYFNGFDIQCWTELNQLSDVTTRIFILDTMGQLGHMYSLSDIAIIGGAFTTGVHNVMEPAAMGNAILFGPKHQNAQEAQALIDSKGAFCFTNAASFATAYMALAQDKNTCKQAGRKSREYIQSNTGATLRYIEKLKENIH